MAVSEPQIVHDVAVFIRAMSDAPDFPPHWDKPVSTRLRYDRIAHEEMLVDTRRARAVLIALSHVTGARIPETYLDNPELTRRFVSHFFSHLRHQPIAEHKFDDFLYDLGARGFLHANRFIELSGGNLRSDGVMETKPNGEAQPTPNVSATMMLWSHINSEIASTVVERAHVKSAFAVIREQPAFLSISRRPYGEITS